MNTIEVKTSELEGAALDWAVCYVEASDLIGQPINHQTLDQIIERFAAPFSPSTDWSQGGPLIHKYRPDLQTTVSGEIVAYLNNDMNDPDPLIEGRGDTYLIAACRAIVASKLGDAVEVPGELVQR